jgi:hypothetical protein
LLSVNVTYGAMRDDTFLFVIWGRFEV